MTDTIHSGSSSPLRILLIDDEKEILATVGQLLRRMGYEVSTASNGADGLERFERDGAFRKDLYFRLNGFTVHLPPLRERGDDILQLAEHFIDRFAREFRKNVSGLDDGARQLLRRYAFPGNVRERENIIEHAFVRSPGGVVELEHLPAELTSRPADIVALALATSDPMGALEAELARRTLEECGGNRTRAAARLGISRTTLWRKLRGAPSSPAAPRRS